VEERNEKVVVGIGAVLGVAVTAVIAPRELCEEAILELTTTTWGWDMTRV
jgi:hypothetical protein